MNAHNPCRELFEGDPLNEAYHDTEWCKVNHDDRFEFEMLCLEGASVGLSWKLILNKRDAYKKAFHDFEIDRCAAMTDAELEAVLAGANVVRNRSKVFSVRKNAQAVQKIQKAWGSFDAYLWHFTEGQVIDGRWQSLEEIPTQTALSQTISKDMKKRGLSYVGPVITYSFMQAVGIVNDHLADCPYR
ncbi:MAG: DNA-3-methyladenine glycosylase I [Pseudoramibacter sp.]